MRPMSAPPPKPAIRVWPLPYEERLRQRPDAQVDLVVIHCTELPDLAMAREYGERVLYDSGAGNSGHYYIDRDGSVLLFVHPGRIAHHCRGYNDRSIGIELVNSGRYPDWLDSRQQEMREAYPQAQLDALSACSPRCAAASPACAGSPATRTSTPRWSRPATTARCRCRASATRPAVPVGGRARRMRPGTPASLNRRVRRRRLQ
jgi:N-acetylmuramoyl-L-alanine amidase